MSPTPVNSAPIHPPVDTEESDLRVSERKTSAAGAKAVAISMKRSLAEQGVVKTAKNLLTMNQVDGFDCMSCAWPDPAPGERHTAEFCENGAKAVSWEGDRRRVTPEFFAEHSIPELTEWSDYREVDVAEVGRVVRRKQLLDGRNALDAALWREHGFTVRGMGRRP